MLEIRNVEREYVRGKTKFWAVKDVNLTVEKGDFISIIGKSGSGKSTLLNLVAGLLTPTAGEIFFEGENIALFSDEEVSRFRNSQVGYVLQGQSVLANLTVLDNVRLPFYLFKREGDVTKRAFGLLEQVGIAHLTNAYPKELSGGEVRRLAIARALINNPKLLLADEPTSDLDEKNTKEIMELFKKISAQGTAIILVTHDLDNVGYASRQYKMEAGKLQS